MNDITYYTVFGRSKQNNALFFEDCQTRSEAIRLKVEYSSALKEVDYVKRSSSDLFSLVGYQEEEVEQMY